MDYETIRVRADGPACVITLNRPAKRNALSVQMMREITQALEAADDAEAARAAGCRSLTVPYGYNHGHPVQSIATDGIVGSLRIAADLIAA